MGRINPMDYKEGDRLAHRLPDGKLTVAIVVERSNGKLQVEFLDSQGAYGRAWVTAPTVLADNPMKMGDHLTELPEIGTVSLDGVDTHGRLRGTRHQNGREIPLEEDDLRFLLASVGDLIRQQANPEAPFPPDLLAQARAESEAERAGSTSARNIVGTDTQVACVGGAEKKDPVAFQTDTCSVALLSHQGWGYKGFSEDGYVAGVLYANGHEYVYVFTIDQAGGHGEIEGQKGTVSKVVAEVLPSMLDALREDEIDPPDFLLGMITGTNRALKMATARAKEEGTLCLENGERYSPDSPHEELFALTGTVSGVLIVDGETLYATPVGDPTLLVSNSEGEVHQPLPRENEADIRVATSKSASGARDVNAGIQYTHCTTASVGLLDISPERNKGYQVRVHTQKLKPGQRVFLGSDGCASVNNLRQLAAFNRSQAFPGTQWKDRTGFERMQLQLEELLSVNPTPSALVRAFNAFVERSIQSFWGPGDNETMAAVEILPRAASAPL
jgi:hypothetical protein